MSFAALAQELPIDPAVAQSRAAALDLRETARALDAGMAGKSAEAVLETAIKQLFPGQIAVLSSFGTEAAVVLHLVAEIDRSVPILFLETGKHFTETLMYRDILIDRFGFTDAREIKPDP